MKKIILLSAFLSALHAYSYIPEEEGGGFFSSNNTTEEFDDDGEGPPVEDPPVPINNGLPYLVGMGILLAAGYYLMARKSHKQD